MFRLQLARRLVPNSTRGLSVLPLAASWLLVLSSAADAFDITQITNNSTDDSSPAISGSNVVWTGCDGGSDRYCTGGDWEIYLWNGATITNITNNSSSEGDAAISGSNVVWSGHDGNDREVYRWDGATTTQITNNSDRDWDPQVSGSNVVW